MSKGKSIDTKSNLKYYFVKLINLHILIDYENEHTKILGQIKFQSKGNLY